MKFLVPALILLMGTITAQVHLVESNGEDVVFLIDGQDFANGPEQFCQSHMFVDLEYRYTVTNNTPTVQQVDLCQTGSRQTVELWSDDGAVLANMSFALVPTSLLIQPGATEGPDSVIIQHVSHGWQTLWGNVPGLEGPPGVTGCQVKVVAKFPKVLITQSNGCRVTQTVHVRAHIRIQVS